MNARVLATVLFTLSLAGCGGGSSSSAPPPNTPPPSNDPPPATPAPSPDKWTAVAPLPQQRTEAASAAHDGKLYLVGGGVGTDGAGSLTIPAALTVYDPASDSWSELAPIPDPVHHAAMVAHAGKLYVMGGWRGSGQSQIEVDNLWIYDIASDSWSAGAAMPTARGALGAAVIDGKIHAVGGAPIPPFFQPPVPVAAHEIYDTATGLWSTGASIPNGREHLAVAAVGGKLYVASGRMGGPTTDRFTMYDPATQQWSALAEVLTPRGGGALIAFQGELYLIGGERLPEGSASGTGDAVPITGTNAAVYSVVEIYNPEAASWRTGDPLPAPRHGLSAGVIGNAIHVAGGSGIPGWAYSTTHYRWEP